MLNESYRTPSRSPPHEVPDTVQRTRYFEHFDTRHDDESMAEVAAAHNIDERTGRRWRRERRDLGDIIAYRRTRKAKAELLGTTLGRPF